MRGLGTYYEIDVVCRGAVDAVSGYMEDIGRIDDAVREHAIPFIAQAMRDRPQTEPAELLHELAARIAPHLDADLSSLRWRLTPYYSVAMNTDTPDQIILRQQFSFAAAHRLHADELTADQNRDVFGKCNNLNGHGHNYRVEVTVMTSPTSGSITLADMERIVADTVIARFDHKHLNLDTEEFAETIPSVEHITRACYDLLESPIADASGRLESVEVWETEKTSCIRRRLNDD